MEPAELQGLKDLAALSHMVNVKKIISYYNSYVIISFFAYSRSTVYCNILSYTLGFRVWGLRFRGKLIFEGSPGLPLYLKRSTFAYFFWVLFDFGPFPLVFCMADLEKGSCMFEGMLIDGLIVSDAKDCTICKVLIHKS